MTLGCMPVAGLERRGRLAGLDDAAIVDLVGRHQYMKRVAVVEDDGTETGKVLRRSRFFDGCPTWSEVFASIGDDAKTAGTYV